MKRAKDIEGGILRLWNQAPGKQKVASILLKMYESHHDVSVGHKEVLGSACYFVDKSHPSMYKLSNVLRKGEMCSPETLSSSKCRLIFPSFFLSITQSYELLSIGWIRDYVAVMVNRL